MKKNYWNSIMVWFVGALPALNLVRVLVAPGTVQAERKDDVVGRYQITSYGTYSGGTTYQHGYYIVDTVTGKIVDQKEDVHSSASP